MTYRNREDSNKDICKDCKWYDPEIESDWHCGHITISPEWCLDPHRDTEKGRYFQEKGKD